MTSVNRGGATDTQRRVWAASLFGSVLAVGTIGYMLLGLSFLDALYQTAITVTTVGFGEITSDGDPTTTYRWFTLGLVLVGASAAVFAAGIVIEAMVDNRAGVFRERRMARQIAAMRGHTIICGYGRVGQAVARRADGLGSDIVVIDGSADRLDTCPHPSIVGDATMNETLEQASIAHAAALVAALPEDAANAFLAVSAQQLNPGVRIVSRANESDNANKLRAMKIDTVVEPYEMAGARLATAAIRPNTSAYLDQVFSTESDRVELTEVAASSGSPLVGRDVADIEQRFAVVVVAHRAAGDAAFSSPRAFTGIVAAGDVIIVLGDRDAVTAIQAPSS